MNWALTVAVLSILSAPVAALAAEPSCGVFGPDSLSIHGDVFEIQILGYAPPVPFSKSDIEKLVKKSALVARHAIAETCEPVTDSSGKSVLASYKACYTADTIEIRLLGFASGFPLCTSEVKEALDRNEVLVAEAAVASKHIAEQAAAGPRAELEHSSRHGAK